MIELNALSRCDRCGAQAYLMTLHSGNSLLWCNHHFNKHQELLKDKIYVDERSRLATTK